MKLLLHFSRIFVGVLFIFSGLVKANDPLGLSYKMQEFFELWGLHALNDYTLAFSIIMIAFEIIAGVAILVGWQMRLFSWLLLLLIIFFTFLTGYAVITGTPKECGCFGNCIPLTAQQSFMKDLILLALILFIFFFRNKIQPLFKSGISLLILFFSAIFSLALMWYSLQHLPIVDCLPYEKGKSINAQMKVPPGSVPDSTSITFVYDKGGKEVEFGAADFPEDFNDSLYKFKRRYDKVIRKGNAEPAIKDFVLTNSEGAIITDSLLNADGLKFMLMIRKGYSRSEWAKYLEPLIQQAAQRKISFILVTAMPLNEAVANAPEFLKLFPVNCDATAIKTAARSNPTLYLLNKDVITNKWGQADFDEALRWLSSQSK